MIDWKLIGFCSPALMTQYMNKEQPEKHQYIGRSGKSWQMLVGFEIANDNQLKTLDNQLRLAYEATGIKYPHPGNLRRDVLNTTTMLNGVIQNARRRG